MSNADIIAKLVRWVKQNPEANAGDHAGQELLDLVRSLRATAMEAPRPDATRAKLPLSYIDGPDYCTVKDATGADFALTVQPKLMQAMEIALSKDGTGGAA